MGDTTMEVVRRVSRTPRGGSKMMSKIAGGLNSIATTSTPLRISSRAPKERSHGGEGDSTSPVIKRRRLSDRTNKFQPTRESTPAKMITPPRMNTRSRASLENAASPSVEKLLSQEDSFLAEFSEQMMMQDEENLGVIKEPGEGG